MIADNTSLKGNKIVSSVLNSILKSDDNWKSYIPWFNNYCDYASLEAKLLMRQGKHFNVN